MTSTIDINDITLIVLETCQYKPYTLMSQSNVINVANVQVLHTCAGEACSDTCPAAGPPSPSPSASFRASFCFFECASLAECACKIPHFQLNSVLPSYVSSASRCCRSCRWSSPACLPSSHALNRARMPSTHRVVNFTTCACSFATLSTRH